MDAEIPCWRRAAVQTSKSRLFSCEKILQRRPSVVAQVHAVQQVKVSVFATADYRILRKITG